MKILAFAATNSSQSINKRLVGYAGRILTENDDSIEVDIIDLNDFEMPIYSFDREQDGGVPQQAQEFHRLIGEADAVVISFAEHNGSFTAAYKNLFDWTSRVDRNVYQGKPTVMLAATPGPRAGAGVLAAATTLAPFFGNDLKGSLGIPRFNDNFDPESNTLIDAELDAQLRATLATLTDVEQANVA